MSVALLVLQVAAQKLFLGLSIQKAVNVARVHHQLVPDLLEHEQRFDKVSCLYHSSLSSVSLPLQRSRVKVTALSGKPISELRCVICHMRSHSVNCHPTQVNAAHLNPSQATWYLICLPRGDERLSSP